MKLTNAIKKLGKYTEVRKLEYSYQAIQGNQAIEFFENGTSGEITCIRVRSIHDKDDIMSDYCAGSFCDNLTQAIKIARFQEAVA